MKTLIKLAKELRKELHKGLKKIDFESPVVGYVTGSKQM